MKLAYNIVYSQTFASLSRFGPILQCLEEKEEVKINSNSSGMEQHEKLTIPELY